MAVDRLRAHVQGPVLSGLVLAAARESPEWSSRQLATWVTDHLRPVGESTVYRILKREGLVSLLLVKSTSERPPDRIRCGLPMLRTSGSCNWT